MKKECYTSYVCPNCLVKLHGHTDIDFVDYWTCPECDYIITQYDKIPIGTIVIN